MSDLIREMKTPGERQKAWRSFNKVMRASWFGEIPDKKWHKKVNMDSSIADADDVLFAAKLDAIKRYIGPEAAAAYKISDGNLRLYEGQS